MNPAGQGSFDVALIWQVAGWVVIGIGGLVLLWALFRDRSRGRRRCPKCWYDMAGVPGLKCPECGREAKNERKLQKTRRRWRWAVLAVVFLLAGSVSLRVPALQKDGWVAATPTFVLRAGAWVQRERARELFEGKLPSANGVWPANPQALPLGEWERVLVAWYAGHVLNDPMISTSFAGTARADRAFLCLRFGGKSARVAIPDLVLASELDNGIMSIMLLRDLAALGDRDALLALDRVARRARQEQSRLLAAYALTSTAISTGDGLQLVHELVAKTNDPNIAGSVTRAAVDSSKFLPPTAPRHLAIPLIEQVLSHPDKRFRDVSLPEVVRLSDWLPLEATLIGILQYDTSPANREQIAKFSQSRDSLSERWGLPLVRACEDADYSVRVSAVDSLINWCQNTSWPKGELSSWLVQRDIEAPLADGTKRDSLSWGRGQLESIEQYESPRVIHLLYRLAPGHPGLLPMYQRWAMSHPEVAGRIAAIEALGAMDETTSLVALELLSETLANEPEARVRATAVRWLSLRAAADTRALDLLADALADVGFEVRFEVAIALGQIGRSHAGAEEALAELTASDWRLLAIAAADALEAIRAGSEQEEPSP